MDAQVKKGTFDENRHMKQPAYRLAIGRDCGCQTSESGVFDCKSAYILISIDIGVDTKNAS
jgi:hypothetical protein